MGGGNESGVENWDDYASVLVFVLLITSVHARHLSVTLTGQGNVLHKTR